MHTAAIPAINEEQRSVLVMIDSPGGMGSLSLGGRAGTGAFLVLIGARCHPEAATIKFKAV